GEVAIPPCRQVSPLHLIDLARKLRVRRPVRREERRPVASSGSAARTDAGGEVIEDAVGDQELRPFRPAIAALGGGDLLVTERLAVGGGGFLLVRGAVADVAVQDDERGSALRRAEDRERLLDVIEVVGVTHAQYVPPVGQEPGSVVLREVD